MQLRFDRLIDAFDTPKHPDGIVYYQEVAVQIRRQGDLGIGFLFGRLHNAGIVHVRSILVGLTSPILESATLRDMLKQRLRAYIHDRRPLVVGDGCD
jgi:hypothetical protein